MKKTIAVLAVLAALTTISNADERYRSSAQRNYILRRQQSYQVQGVPTSRLIIGKREIDIYPNGLMFERDHVVGIRSGR
jgi:hypothetical protein